MSDQYVVTGPLAIATTQEGAQVYVYEGRALPEDVSEEEAQRLVDVGLVRKASDIEKDQKAHAEEARRVHAEQEEVRTEKADTSAKRRS